MPSAASSILVLTTSSSQADLFVTRLLAHSSQAPPPTAKETRDGIPYRIDNKYYSADVHVVVRELDGPVEGGEDGDFPVLVWLLPEEDPSSSSTVPAALRGYLTAISSTPPDVALSVITTATGSNSPPNLSEDTLEHLTDAYDELGFELINERESASPEEDDEDNDSFSASLSPLEQISQAIQTHLWPTLVLKPKPTSAGPPASASLPRFASSSSQANPAPAFPQSFSSSFEFDDSPTISASTSGTPISSTEADDFGPLQSSAVAPSAADPALEFTADDFSAALSSLHSASAGPQATPQRAFTDSFAPSTTTTAAATPALPAFPSSFETFRPPPENGELPSSSDLFGGPDSGGFMRLVDDDDDEDGPSGGGEMVDLTSTLMNLRGLRDELGRVEDEQERRKLAALAVEGLFGGLLGGDDEEDDEDEEGEVGLGGERREGQRK